MSSCAYLLPKTPIPLVCSISASLQLVSIRIEFGARKSPPRATTKEHPKRHERAGIQNQVFVIPINPIARSTGRTSPKPQNMWRNQHVLLNVDQVLDVD